LCERVIVSIRSGKLSFHDLKSQGKVSKFNYRRPVGTVSDRLHLFGAARQKYLGVDTLKELFENV